MLPSFILLLLLPLLPLQEVSTITTLLPESEGSSSSSGDDSGGGCLISADWLEGWVNNEGEPGPLDNSVLLCEHHKLSPLLPAGSFKYISDTAWDHLTVRVWVFVWVWVCLWGRVEWCAVYVRLPVCVSSLHQSPPATF